MSKPSKIPFLSETLSCGSSGILISMDGHYQAHYLPASLSYVVDNYISLLYYIQENEKPIDRIRAILRIRPLITDTQTITLDC